MTPSVRSNNAVHLSFSSLLWNEKVSLVLLFISTSWNMKLADSTASYNGTWCGESAKHARGGEQQKSLV
jgi:hypothetical protein